MALIRAMSAMVLSGLPCARAAYFARLRISAIWVAAHLPPRHFRTLAISRGLRPAALEHRDLDCDLVRLLCLI